MNASYVVRDEHPTTPSSAYELLVRRSDRFHSLNRSTDRPRNRGYKDQQNNNTGVVFLQTYIFTRVSDIVPVHDGTTTDIECYYCHERGTSNNYPRSLLIVCAIHVPETEVLVKEEVQA